jgi:hypothetical protein
MANQTESDDGRTDTKRFTDDVSAEDLIEGDRIKRALVAPTPDLLGDQWTATHAEDTNDAPTAQLAVVTTIKEMSDVHTAILVDTDAEMLIRASRTDRQQAMSQSEADWTVRAVGSEINVTDVDRLEVADNDTQPDDSVEYVQSWAEVLFHDMVAGHFDYSDERKMTSSTTLHLRDIEGREALATIGLTD